MNIYNQMENYFSFKYLVDLRANDSNFQNSFWIYWGNWGYFHSSGRVNNYDSDWEKGYPLLIQSHNNIIELLGKVLSDRDKKNINKKLINYPKIYLYQWQIIV
jgi:hypothetical protein